jgi:hypothetical protein
LDLYGRAIESSPWLSYGKIYHVMAIYNEPDGKRSFSIISRQPEGEWPQMGSHPAECFEIISDVIPSNWCAWEDENGSGISPISWQTPGFSESFYEHDPAVFHIFERERDIILAEDPE